MPLEPKRGKKRGQSELDALGPRMSETDLAKNTTTRRGTLGEAVPVKKGKFDTRNTADYLYPSDRGVSSGPGRTNMSDKVTKGMLERSLNDTTATSLSRSIVPLEGGKPQLKDRGVSRDHILADSRIRNILREAFGNSNPRTAGKTSSAAASDLTAKEKGSTFVRNRPAEEKRAALTRFFTALLGETQGEDLGRRFNTACVTRSFTGREAVISEAVNGLLNLRFGDAPTNGVVSNEFDPVVIDNRLAEESMEIRDATIGLANAGLISFKTQSDALSVTKDRHTHEDVTSSVMRSATIASQTGTRTVINAFAAPKDPRMFARSKSVPPEETPPQTATQPVMAPAREFDYLSRRRDEKPGPDFNSNSNAASASSSPVGMTDITGGRPTSNAASPQEMRDINSNAAAPSDLQMPDSSDLMRSSSPSMAMSDMNTRFTASMNADAMSDIDSAGV